MRLLLLILLFTLFVGCSKNAVYQDVERDTLFDPQLLGTWKDESTEKQTKPDKTKRTKTDPLTVVVERVDDTNQYRFRCPNGDQKEDVLLGYLVPVGDDRILDIIDDKTRLHVILRLRMDGEKIAYVDTPDFFKLLKRMPNLVPHKWHQCKATGLWAILNPERAKPYDCDVTLTGTSEELQAFFREHSKEIWKKPDDTTKLRKTE